MQAMAAEFSGCRRKPPSLFELRRVRNAGKVAPYRSDGGIPLLYVQKRFNSSFRFIYFKSFLARNMRMASHIA